MKLLLVLWTVVRNAFESAVWATLVWTAAKLFYPLEWVPLFWIFFAILFISGLGAMGAGPWPMLAIDPMLVGLAILQAAVCSLVATVITIIVVCGFYTLWRRNGKKRAIQSWKGEPKPVWQPSGYFKGPTPINHLPEWQRKLLEEHREQRVLKKVEPGRGVWTRAPFDGSLVTEVELYWAQVLSLADNKIGFTVYSKKSGQMANLWLDCASEKQAMDLAVDCMLYGKSPDLAGDVRAEPATEQQPENGALQTERDLVDAIALSASKSAKRIVDFIPDGEKKSDLTIKTYLEYLCFFVHATNRLASNVASYQEVDRMYNTIAPLVREYVIHEVFTSVKEEHIRQVWREAITELIKARDPSPVLASRENRDHQRATGPVYRASFSTRGYRRLTPRFLPVSLIRGLEAYPLASLRGRNCT
jgi:hypothetical protein